METFDAEKIEKLYFEYVDTFKIGGALPPMMELKRVHTMKVVVNADLICSGEGFDGPTSSACRTAALLHDTGRYEQLKKYNTFRDSDSVDHAVYSHDIVKEKGWLDPLPQAARTAILNAVLFHNRRELPEKMDPLEETASKCVRDADKLDIFRVLEERIATTDWKNDRTAFWNLKYDLPPNKAVIDAIENGSSVDYQEIKSIADFILIQMGWIKNGLYFETSRSIARERKHWEFRRKFLKELTGTDFF